MRKSQIESRLERLEKRVTKIENIISKKRFAIGQSTRMGDLEGILVEKIDEIPTQHLVVIILKLKRKQTRAEIKAMLEDWGKVVGNWFKGGNLNNRLIKKNIVKRDGVNDNNEESFSLTKKGELLAEELINKIKTRD